jgi:hypothetical protein
MSDLMNSADTIREHATNLLPLADSLEAEALAAVSPFRYIPKAQAQAMATTICNLNPGRPAAWGDVCDYLERILIHDETTIQGCYSEEASHD